MLGGWLDLMILEAFSNLGFDDSMPVPSVASSRGAASVLGGPRDACAPAGSWCWHPFWPQGSVVFSNYNLAEIPDSGRPSAPSAVGIDLFF